MEFEMKVLTPLDASSIEDFERQKLAAQPGESFEKEMSSWSARWRKESLDHYLSLGWSFGVRSSDGQLQAYLLGQALLFFQGFTQSLWVEHLSYRDEAAGKKLVEAAYRWARDKHLQRVLFSTSNMDPLIFAGYPIHNLPENIVELKSSKYE